MTKFLETLRKAQQEHLTDTGENVSDTSLSYKLWKNNNKGTVANSMKKLRDKGFSKGVCHKLLTLKKTFPNVPLEDWLKR